MAATRLSGEGRAEAVDKPALYARSDVVTPRVPLTALTRGLIDALAGGRLWAAAIDCHHPEPPPADYPVFGLGNVILTPHVAARVREAVQRMSDVVHDVVAVLEDRRPKYPAPADAV